MIYLFQNKQINVLDNSDISLKYIIALINNNYKAYEYVETYEFLLKQISKVNDNYTITYEIKDIYKGFNDIKSHGINIIVDKIFKDLDLPFSKLFRKEWYELYKDNNSFVSNPKIGATHIEMIIGTIQDYIDNDILSFTNHIILNEISKTILYKLIIRYCEELFNSKNPYIIDSIVNQIEIEIKLLEFYFSNWIKSKIFLKCQISLLQILVNLIYCPIEDIVDIYIKIFQIYNDFQRKC